MTDEARMLRDMLGHAGEFFANYRPATEIHRNYCARCPSAPGMPDDEETEEYAAADFSTRLEAVFHCGWRYGKACRGICERLRITAADLAARTKDNA